MKIQEGEKILHELRPEKILLVCWFFSKCMPLFFFGFFISFVPRLIYIGNAKSNFSFWEILITPIFIIPPILLIIGLTYCSFLRKTYVYTITNHRCVLRKGIFHRIERSVPYHKITDVERSQNIIERILGISSLNIFTPGTASMSFSPYGGGGQQAEISFIALKDNETPAETITEILRKCRSIDE